MPDRTGRSLSCHIPIADFVWQLYEANYSQFDQRDTSIGGSSSGVPFDGKFGLQWGKTITSVVNNASALSQNVPNSDIQAETYPALGLSGQYAEAVLHWARARKTYPKEITASLGSEVQITNPASLTIYSNSPLCQGENLQLQTDDLVGANYTWKNPAGSTIGTGYTYTEDNMSPNQSGTYSVLVEQASAGCSQVLLETLVEIYPQCHPGQYFIRPHGLCHRQHGLH
ncbi:MAG: hypothetical protein HC896_13075 [Bacteroidales bacterium]|nr:hypothetical protein [Bacteroidales bacterium]